MSQEKPDQAQASAAKYAAYPVDRWREAFAAVTAQVAEITGVQAAVVAAEDRSQQYSGQFSHIRPNATQAVELPQGQTSHAFPLPPELLNRNVLVEITGGSETKSQAYYSNSLAVQLIENYGQVRVTHSGTGQPLPTVYIKVYAQMQDGSVRFFKDGYTDLRGRFEYTSLSTNELDFAQKFSLLILSDQHGAVVREANPPKR